MIPPQPPLWLQRMLLLILKRRDRETISGDLLEEYRERQVACLGPVRLNYWYLRQVISLACFRVSGGPFMKQLLIAVCFFSVLAGTWLGVMENILKHDGYAGRSLVAACIAVQALATLLLLRLNGPSAFRVAVLFGTVGILWLGGSALRNLARAQHFEGFVLVIGAALILQGALTFLTIAPRLERGHRHHA